MALSKLILGLRSANERWHYFVMPSLIGWVQAWNQPCAWSQTVDMISGFPEVWENSQTNIYLGICSSQTTNSWLKSAIVILSVPINQ